MAQNVNEIGDMSHILLASNITSGQVTQTWETILNPGTRSGDLNHLESQGSGKMLYVYYLSNLSFMHFVLLLWIDVLISHHVAIPCQISERMESLAPFYNSFLPSLLCSLTAHSRSRGDQFFTYFYYWSLLL